MDDTQRLHGLHPRIHSRIITIKDLQMHVLECLPFAPETLESQHAPLALLLHGFPELAYSWRKTMVPLADRGYHVIAPDQRGFGRTVPEGTRISFSDDSEPYKMLNLVDDIISLVKALGYDSVKLVVGHDFGSTVAGYCAIFRPDLFPSLVMMSSPFTGPPPENFRHLIEQRLAALDPPRKHYTVLYSGPDANKDMCGPDVDALRKFLRNYLYVKGGEYSGNHEVRSLQWETIGDVPNYYVMREEETMSETASRMAGSIADISSWMTEEELEVYVSEFHRTGFQGGLNRYRCYFGEEDRELRLAYEAAKGSFKGVKAAFIAGNADWGVRQFPGAMEAMVRLGVDNVHLVEGAGHWIQQEVDSEKWLSRL